MDALTPEAKAERDARMVMAHQLPTNATEDEVREFFEVRAGPVAQAVLVKDKRTGGSIGVGYIEFVSAASVGRALAQSGSAFKGRTIIVQPTLAEKNRAAAFVVLSFLPFPYPLSLTHTHECMWWTTGLARHTAQRR